MRNRQLTKANISKIEFCYIKVKSWTNDTTPEKDDTNWEKALIHQKVKIPHVKLSKNRATRSAAKGDCIIPFSQTLSLLKQHLNFYLLEICFSFFIHLFEMYLKLVY